MLRRSHNVVALVTDSRALPEDCRRADIVISAVPVRRSCGAAMLVVDRFDLWRKGAHAIWLDAGGVRIETAAGVNGGRPWSPLRRRRVNNAASGRSTAPKS